MVRTLALALLAATLSHAQEKGPRTLALLVGCTEYPALKKKVQPATYKARIMLRGPVNDVALMRRTLVDSLGVAEKDIATLTGWPKDEAARPTRKNILAHFARLAREAQKGDRVIIHMAGHGSQQADTDGEELDGLDEIFLPADVVGWSGKKGKVKNAITDDEIREALRAIRAKGATVWAIFDCCHSGSMARGGDDDDESGYIRERRLDPELLGVVAESRTRGGGDDEKELEKADLDGIVAFYGAQSYRTAPEMNLPKRSDHAKPYGLMTFMIARHIQQTGGNLSFAELHAQVLAAYRALPYHNTVPQAEGDLRKLRVAGGAAAGGPILQLRKQRGDLVLDAGTLRGIVAGTVLEVFAPGKFGEKEGRLGSVVVRKAELVQSMCRARKGDPLPKMKEMPRVCRVRVVSTPVGDHRLKIAVVGGTLSEDVAAIFAKHKARFPLVKRKDADWLLVVDGERLSLEPVRTGGRGLRYAATPDDLEALLHRVFRVANLTRLASGNVIGRLPKGVVLQVLKGGKPMRSGDVVRPGERVSISLRNTSGRTYDVTLLMIDANYGIGTLFPYGGQTPRLSGKDKKAVNVGDFNVTDHTQGIENLLLLAVPRRDSDPEVDLSVLSQPPLEVRTRGGGGVSELLNELAFGTTMRGLAAAPAELALGLFTLRMEWGAVAPPEKFGGEPVPVIEDRHVTASLAETDRARWELESDSTRFRGDISALYAKAAPTVVVVRTKTGHGTGTFIDARHVITNHHVIANGAGYSKRGYPLVHVLRGKLDEDGVMQTIAQPMPAEVILDDARRDLALLRVTAPKAWFEGIKPAGLADKGPRPGMECYMIGHPSGGMLWSLRQGNISAVGRMPHDMVDMIVHRIAASTEYGKRIKAQLAGRTATKITLSSCQGNSGDSGGPLFDGEGRLLAVTYAIPKDVRGDKFVYHIHLAEVRAFLAQKPAAKVQVPDAWQLGPNKVLKKTAAGGGFDLLLAGVKKPAQLLFDLDGDTEAADASPATVEQLVRKRAFEAEVALHFHGDRRVAWYDTDNDGTFDLILIDNDTDPEADVRFALRDGSWTAQTDLAIPWLSSGYFSGNEMKKRAMEKFSALKQ